MFTSIKRPLYVLSNKLRLRRQPVESMKEKWTADFSRPEKSCFDIKPEISCNAYLENGSLFLGQKKKNYMAWVETLRRVYTDQLIEARFRFDTPGTYSAAGIMFRVVERGTYYLALVSGEGNFRLDAVNNGVPRPLTGWVETPGLNESGVKLNIIAAGDHLVFILNGKWVAEVHDASIPGGHLGFALVSCEADTLPETQFSADNGGYTCRAWLDFLSVDSRSGAVETEYKKWNNSEEISAESRLRLARNCAALGNTGGALNQILKAWKQREEVARSVMATYTEMRAKGELLLAAQMAVRLEQYTTAEEYINVCLAMGMDGAEELEVFAVKARILSVQNRYSDLAEFLPEYINRIDAGEDHTYLHALYALLGHTHWNLKDYESAAAAWDTAFGLNKNNGLYAVNAARAFELLGRTEEALRRHLDGGNCFLQQEDYAELEALVPRLLALGENNWEARILVGKWAFNIGDFDRAEAELTLAEKQRRAMRPAPKADPAAYCLCGDLLNRRGKPSEALVFFSKAVRLAPKSGIFRFKLAETRYRLDANPHSPELAADLQAACTLLPNDHNLLAFTVVIEQARADFPPEHFAPATLPPQQPEPAAPSKTKPAAAVKKAGTKPAAKPEPKPEVKPATKPAAKPEVKPATKLAPKPKPKPEVKAKQGAAAAKKAALKPAPKTAGAKKVKPQASVKQVTVKKQRQSSQ